MKPVFFPCCIWIVFTHAVTLAIAICLLYFCIPFQFPFSKRYPIDVLGTNLCAWGDDYSQEKQKKKNNPTPKHFIKATASISFMCLENEIFASHKTGVRCWKQQMWELGNPPATHPAAAGLPQCSAVLTAQTQLLSTHVHTDYAHITNRSGSGARSGAKDPISMLNVVQRAFTCNQLQPGEWPINRWTALR